MNILFWNLQKKQNIKVIQELISEHNIDVAFFCEYLEEGMKNVIKQLGASYWWADGFGGCDKVTMVARRTCSSAIIRREQSRHTVYSIKYGTQVYVIAAVHMEDRKNYADYTRINTARSVIESVEEQESNLHTDKSIIIGDFNANPFSPEMISKVSFNSVIFKSMMSQEIIQFEGNKKRRLYNPILQYVRDEYGMRGSIYCSSDDLPLYWNAFDQVLMNKKLMNSFQEMKYITKTSTTNLMSKVGPNKTYSDHLPLVVRFVEDNQNV